MINLKKLYLLGIVSLIMVIFYGCNGSDIKNVNIEKEDNKIEEENNSEENNSSGVL